MKATTPFSFWPKANCLLTAIAIAAGSTILDAQTYTQLHCFNNSSKDGNGPLAGLTLGGNTLYGTTGSGGSAYNGIVFSINTDGSAYTVLKKLHQHGRVSPVSDLVLNSGVLYGTTQAGGDTFNGTVFRVSTNGSGYKVLKSFSTMNTAYMTNTFGTNTDGAQPRGSLVFDGNSLYGTTYFGGLAGNGTVFKVNPDGLGFAVLKSFSPTFQGSNDVSLNIWLTVLTLMGQGLWLDCCWMATRYTGQHFTVARSATVSFSKCKPSTRFYRTEIFLGGPPDRL